MSGIETQKFEFELEFDGGGNAAPHRSARPKTRYSAQEVEEIRASAFAEGRSSVEAKAAEDGALALNQLTAAAQQIIDQLDAQIHAMKEHCFQTATFIGQQLSEQALKQYPLEDIHQVVSECIERLHQESRLIVTVPEDVREALEPRLIASAESHEFAGRLVVESRPDLQCSECCIEWSDGGSSRSMDDVHAEISQLIERHLATEKLAIEQADLFENPEAGSR